MSDETIKASLEALEALSPLGYSVGFRIRFSRPTFTKITYPDPWVELYKASNYFLCDPAIAWGITHTGTTRWSAITLPDPFGIMEKAAEHGLKYGAVISTGSMSSKSIAGIARSDREFTEAEIEEARVIVEDVHEALGKAKSLQPIHIEALELFSLGLSYDEICEKLDISRTALKSRLDTARRRLGATSNVNAVHIATDRGILDPDKAIEKFGLDDI